MAFDPENLIHQLTPFTAKMFNLIVAYNEDKEKGLIDNDMIKCFDCFDTKEYLITPEIMQGMVQLFIDTKDRHYLVEAAILILMLDHDQEKAITEKV